MTKSFLAQSGNMSAALFQILLLSLGGSPRPAGLGLKKARDKTSLTEHSGQGGLLRTQEQWQWVFDPTARIGFVGA